MARRARPLVAARSAAGLGGARFPRLLAATATAFLPIPLSLGSIYSMNAMDLLLWAVALWLVTRILSGGDERLWLAFGVVCGLGLLNKISVLFLGFGLLVGLLLARRFSLLRSRWFWASGLVALAIFLPHLLWQHANGWPTLAFMANAG